VGLSNYRQREGWRHFGVQLLAFLQLTAVGLVPAADALLLEASADDPIHVEALGTDSCEAPHDHAYCQLCRLLSVAGAAAPGDGAVAPFAAEHVALATGHVHSSTPAAHLLGGLGSRAPPVA
jgi:hypothetical protein